MAVVQAILDGLMIGGVYAVISIGLTLVFGVMGIVNFAQAEFLMHRHVRGLVRLGLARVRPVLAAPLAFAVASCSAAVLGQF